MSMSTTRAISTKELTYAFLLMGYSNLFLHKSRLLTLRKH